MPFDKNKTIQELLELSDEYSKKYPECSGCFVTLNELIEAASQRDRQDITNLNLDLFAIREFDGWIPPIAERLFGLNNWAKGNPKQDAKK